MSGSQEPDKGPPPKKESRKRTESPLPAPRLRSEEPKLGRPRFLGLGHGLECTAMALTPEQHAEIAASYANAATDLFVSPKQREAFARKAEFFRLMAKLAAKKSASAQAAEPPRIEEAARKQPPESPPSGDALPKAVEEFLERPGSPESSPPTPAHIMALMHLALRWRLFRLETETFGRGRAKH